MSRTFINREARLAQLGERVLELYPDILADPRVADDQAVELDDDFADDLAVDDFWDRMEECNADRKICHHRPSRRCE